MEFYITGCQKDCPFYNWDNEVCMHPGNQYQKIVLKENELHPSDCPLVEEHLSIHLKQPTV